jgi:HEAT repeat protein
MLAANDPEIRRRGVIGLEEDVGEETVSLLALGLGDVDWRVRKEAVRVTTAVAGAVRVVPAMVAAIVQGENVGLRNAALEVLGNVGASATPDLLEALPRVPPGARKFVIGALGDAGDLGAVPPLVQEAEGNDPNNAAAAIDALARLGGPEAERALRRRLGSNDPFQRMAALDGLHRLRAVIPWSELEPILDDRLVRRLVLSVLGRCGREAAVGTLIEALRDRSPSAVAVSAVSLVQLYDESDRLAELVSQQAMELGEPSRAALRQLVAEGDLPTRQAAAHLLLLARDVPALPSVVGLAAESALSPAALSALTMWGVAAVRPLLAIQSRSSGAVRGTALELAADLAAEGSATEDVDDALVKSVRAAILTALDSRDPFVTRAGARSLTWWARAEDVPTLVELASRSSGELAHACGAALEALAASAPGAVEAALSQVSLDGAAGIALAGVVARLGVPGAFEQLQAGLSAQEPDVRRATVNALSVLGGERAAELIGYALTDEVLDVRTTAARALGQLRDANGRPLGAEGLLLALAADSPSVQAAAARALGGLGEGRAIEPLRELVRRGDAGVSVAAMEALRVLQDPTFDDLLVEALGHPDEEVVKQALHAICDARGPRTVGRLAVGLEHPAWHVRGLSARLLGDIGSDEAVEVLEGRREREHDPMVAGVIARALETRRGV